MPGCLRQTHRLSFSQLHSCYFPYCARLSHLLPPLPPTHSTRPIFEATNTLFSALVPDTFCIYRTSISASNYWCRANTMSARYFGEPAASVQLRADDQWGMHDANAPLQGCTGATRAHYCRRMRCPNHPSPFSYRQFASHLLRRITTQLNISLLDSAFQRPDARRSGRYTRVHREFDCSRSEFFAPGPAEHNRSASRV